MKKIKVLSKKANHDGINGAILSIMIYYALLVVLCVLSFFTGALLWLAESAAPILEIEKGHVTFYIGCFIIMVLPSAFLSFASLSRNRKVLKTIFIYLLVIALFFCLDYLFITNEHWFCELITKTTLEKPLGEFLFITIVCQVGFLICHLFMFTSVDDTPNEKDGFWNKVADVIKKVLVFKDDNPVAFIWISTICLTIFACFIAFIALVILPVLFVVWIIESAPETSNMSLSTYDYRDYTYTISNSMGCEETLTYYGVGYKNINGMPATSVSEFISDTGTIYYTTDNGQTFIESK